MARELNDADLSPGAADSGPLSQLRIRNQYPEGWKYGSSQSLSRRHGPPIPKDYLGLEDHRQLGWSHWQMHLQDNFDTLSLADGIVTIAYQRSEAKVRRVDHGGASADQGSVTLLPFSGSVWRSDQEVEFDQLYLRLDRFREINGTLQNRDLEETDLLPFTGAQDPVLAHAIRGAIGAISTRSRTMLELDSWASLLSTLVLMRSPGYRERYVSPRPARLRGVALTRLLDFIEANLTSNISLDDLAEMANVSVYHLPRAFKSAMARTPHRYLIERRLIHTQALLRSTSEPLNSIAHKMGFSSQAHMTQAFRRQYGISPGNYRKANSGR